MAHMIEGNQLAYVGKEPWHGLGVKVDAGTTGAEMLKIAGLDWTVEARQLRLDHDGQFLPLVGCTDVDGEGKKGWKAIVRGDTNQVFSIPSKKYEIVQNAAVVDLFREYCEAGHATMETVGGLRGGAVVWALAKLNGGSSRTLKGGDDVNGYVLFSTSHDGSQPTKGKATQVRVVCHNTFSAAYGDSKVQFSMKHSSKWTPERAQEAREQMELATAQSARFNILSQKLSEVSIDQAGRVEFISRLLGGESLIDQAIAATEPVSMLDAVLANTASKDSAKDNMSRVGKAILAAMIDSPGASLESAAGTLWGACNAVSYHVDHQRGRTQDARLSQAWFGVGDTLKTDAVNIAVEMAGINVANL